MVEKAKKQTLEKVKAAELEIELNEFTKVEKERAEGLYRQDVWTLKEHLLGQLTDIKVATE